MILIGSNALWIKNPKLLNRKPLDLDLIATEEEFNLFIEKVKPTVKARYPTLHPHWKKEIIESSINIECEFITPGSSAEEFEKLVREDPETRMTNLLGIDFLTPSLDKLFMLKASHRYLKNSPHFWKTAQDYHNMKSAGAVIDNKEFFKRREKETYYYKHPSLKQNKDNFFADDNIKYVYDHDTIHESVAIYDKPAYTYYIKDGAEVDCDKEKFFKCPLEIRLAGVIEEAAVLAIERSLVPFPDSNKSPKQIWLYALSKVCSSITSGWFREFAYEHLPILVKLYPEGFWEKFQKDLKNGRVLPFTGSKY